MLHEKNSYSAPKLNSVMTGHIMLLYNNICIQLMHYGYNYNYMIWCLSYNQKCDYNLRFSNTVDLITGNIQCIYVFII